MEKNNGRKGRSGSAGVSCGGVHKYLSDSLAFHKIPYGRKGGSHVNT